jgi:hypothetical protein
VGGGCRTLSATGRVVGAGLELTDADYTAGFCSGGMFVDIDGDAGTITLSPGPGFGDYRWATLDITGIDLGTITGLTLLENGLFTSDGGAVIPDPVMSFTGSSMSISFDPPGDGFFDVDPPTGRFTIFSFTTAGSVPVPTPSSLLLVALAGAALLGTRRRLGR